MLTITVTVANLVRGIVIPWPHRRGERQRATVRCGLNFKPLCNCVLQLAEWRLDFHATVCSIRALVCMLTLQILQALL